MGNLHRFLSHVIIYILIHAYAIHAAERLPLQAHVVAWKAIREEKERKRKEQDKLEIRETLENDIQKNCWEVASLKDKLAQTVFGKTGGTLVPTPIGSFGKGDQATHLQSKISAFESYGEMLRHQHDTHVLEGTNSLAETLAWYHLLIPYLRKLVRDYCDFLHPSSADYPHTGFYRFKHTRFDSNIPKLPARQCNYSLYQQMFLVALFNEYNRGECDLPDEHDADSKEVYEIYTSFHEHDRQVMEFMRARLPEIHNCDTHAPKEFCHERVGIIRKSLPLEDPRYYSALPRVMHANDRKDILLLHCGNLYRTCLLVRTMQGKQYPLDCVNLHEELYGALWSNNGKYIVSIKKISVLSDDSEAILQTVAEAEKTLKKNSPQSLDIGGRKKLRKRKKKIQKREALPEEYEASSSDSSNSSYNYLPYCKIKCTVWSWPECVKLEDDIIIDDFDMSTYNQAIQEQNGMLHNYMYTQYNESTRHLTVIIPPYKHRWDYSCKEKKLTHSPMPDVCDGVVMSNGLKRVICPKGPIIRYSTMGKNFTLPRWYKLKWRTYHASPALRAFNITDDGNIIGIDRKGFLLDLPSGRPRLVGHKPKGMGAIRDDWPVIISPNNTCAMLPVWHNPKKPYGVEAPVSWMFWTFPEIDDMLPISLIDYSEQDASRSSSSSTMVSSQGTLASESPSACCITM